jgi:hypothetical protein
VICVQKYTSNLSMHLNVQDRSQISRKIKDAAYLNLFFKGVNLLNCSTHSRITFRFRLSIGESIDQTGLSTSRPLSLHMWTAPYPPPPPLGDETPRTIAKFVRTLQEGQSERSESGLLFVSRKEVNCCTLHPYIQ